MYVCVGMYVGMYVCMYACMYVCSFWGAPRNRPRGGGITRRKKGGITGRPMGFHIMENPIGHPAEYHMALPDFSSQRF